MLKPNQYIQAEKEREALLNSLEDKIRLSTQFTVAEIVDINQDGVEIKTEFFRAGADNDFDYYKFSWHEVAMSVDEWTDMIIARNAYAAEQKRLQAELDAENARKGKEADERIQYEKLKAKFENKS